FRTALASQPLTELLQRDFNAAEKHLKEYEDLCKVEAPRDADPEEQRAAKEESQRRTAVFLSLLARGREQQGRLRDALEAYVRFGSLADTKELVPVIEEPGVRTRPEIWAQGRIAVLFARVKPEERKQLEARIAELWQTADKSKDPAALG